MKKIILSNHEEKETMKDKSILIFFNYQLTETDDAAKEFARTLTAHTIDLTANGSFAVRTPYDGEPRIVDPTNFAGHRKCFSSDHGTLTIVLPDGSVHLTAYAPQSEHFLKALGFEEKEFGSPIRGNEFPIQDSMSFEWARIKVWAMQQREEDFREKCCAVAKSKGVKPLAKSTLAGSLELPADGLKTIYVENDMYGATIRPALNIMSSFEDMNRYIGSYGVDNGWVQFVTHDGRHFISYGYEVIAQLESAGYSRGTLGGKPTDSGSVLVAAFNGGLA